MTDLPNIVTQRLRTGAKPEAHPDADLLTAFFEKSLGERETQDVLKHLAECGDCRDVVALAVPEFEAFQSMPVAGSSAWTSWPVLRWGAAVACVIVVAAVGLHYRPNRPSTSSTILSSDMPVQRRDLGGGQIAENRAATPQATPPAPTEMRKELGAKVASNQIAPAPSTADSAPAKKRSAARDQLDSKTSDALTAQKTAVAEKDASNARCNSSAFATVTGGASSLQLVPGRAKDEAAPAVRTNMALAGGLPNRQAMASSALIARATTVPTSVTPRWTLTSDGMLQRSLDSGRTWETILVASPGTFRALTANGFEIWVGGAKGALYHSIDAGQHWMKVQPASTDESLTSDIVGIEFTDVLHGSLTTSDQQTWITADAGHTWQRQ